MELEIPVADLPVGSEISDGDRRYRLFAVIVHIGSGPNHGHYFALVRSHQHWLCFDDDSVDVIEESQIEACFGNAQDTQASTETGYLLFYQSESSFNSGRGFADSGDILNMSGESLSASPPTSSPVPSPVCERVKSRLGPKGSGVKSRMGPKGSSARSKGAANTYA
mmetsp:Transcript_65741/g.180284  ORF Transcript_65741/g.180284 Transcript_65741/m.180284 type:complete len:166 (+) Transcript_65741:1-498(+)